MTFKKNDSNISLVLFDLEGVIINGQEDDDTLERIKAFCYELREREIEFAILTGSEDTKFVKELRRNRIKVINKSVDKVKDAMVFMKELNLNFQNVLFVGDSILDIPLLQKVKISVTTKSARREVKRAVDHQVSNETVDLLLKGVLNLLN